MIYFHIFFNDFNYNLQNTTYNNNNNNNNNNDDNDNNTSAKLLFLNPPDSHTGVFVSDSKKC